MLLETTQKVLVLETLRHAKDNNVDTTSDTFGATTALGATATPPLADADAVHVNHRYKHWIITGVTSTRLLAGYAGSLLLLLLLLVHVPTRYI